MSKVITLISITTGSLVVFADLPIHFLFGIVFAGIMIEIEQIEKKLYPIVSNIILSSIVGWVFSFGGKHFFPSLFIGQIKIFSMFILTIFSYLTIVYFLRNETIQKLLTKYLTRKTGNDSDSSN